jgi:hypothetical protein
MRLSAASAPGSDFVSCDIVSLSFSRRLLSARDPACGANEITRANPATAIRVKRP